MTNQKTNPRIDWGFHIIIPRIVRTQYKKLTLVEKWLYVCLKDLCGDTGTCFRTLRTLAEETDLSTGTLSTGIRHLQEAGLIHAEKKRRSNNVTGKEVWHITIVDIWQENAKVHPTVKRSIPEQERSTDEHYRENVQDMNNNVQEVNEDASKRSTDEQKRSNFDDRSNNNKAITITEVITIEERESTAPESDTPVSPPSVGALALPSKTEAFIEKLREWRIEDEQQGDAHVDIPPGSADRADTLPSADMGDLPASGQDLRLAAPARRPVVPTGQEKIGDNHAVVATHTPGGGDTARSVDHRPEQDLREAVHGEVVSKKGQIEGQLANTPTPAPAQTTPPTSEQAASGQAAQQTLQAPEKRQSAKVEPLAEPDMSGKWSHEKCVEYAEWCNKRRYTDKMREEQMKAAQSIHKNDGALTLEQFKQAYDERNDAWWQEHKGKLHVNDMKAKGASGIDRVHEMLQRIEDAVSRGKPRQISVVPRVRVFSSYDDPNFRSDQDFYPVEGGSYATAAI